MVAVYKDVVAEAEASSAAAPGRVAARSSDRRLATIRYRTTKVPMVAFYRAFGLGPRRIPGPVKPGYRLARWVMRRALGVR